VCLSKDVDKNLLPADILFNLQNILLYFLYIPRFNYRLFATCTCYNACGTLAGAVALKVGV
jgi:hypothetical protein